MPRSRRFADARHRLRSAVAGQDGSAALEFLTVGVLMLVPLVYVVLALGEIQSQALGVESAARFAARTIASGEADPDRVLQSVTGEYGIDDFEAHVSCLPARDVCPTAGSTVQVTVTAHVMLPLVPSALGLDRLAVLPVEATSSQKVSSYWDAR